MTLLTGTRESTLVLRMLVYYSIIYFPSQKSIKLKSAVRKFCSFLLLVIFTGLNLDADIILSYVQFYPWFNFEISFVYQLSLGVIITLKHAGE